MKSLLLTFTALAVGLSCNAAGQLLKVTPLTLDGWTVTGVDGNALTSGNQLVLPAGAQLSRKFSDSVLVVRLVARPVFTEQGDAWPIFGLGSAAVAFVRQNGQGHLVLVADETAVTDLPWTVPTDSKGEQTAVDLLLAYDRESGTGLISVQDQVQVFDVAPSASLTEMWLSAGVGSDWPIDQLQVLLPDLNSGANVAANVRSANSSGPGGDNTAAVVLTTRS